MSYLAKLRKLFIEFPFTPLSSNSAKSSVGIDAYLIGTEDAHQSEYVSERDKRREFISNFTGSAGTVLVTKSNALLWTDGRYFEQAEKELGSEWTLMKSGEKDVLNIEEYIEKHLPSGSKIGIDPYLTSMAMLRKLESKSKAVQIGRHERYENLVDIVWDKQPSDSKDAVQFLDVKYTGMTVSDKLKNIRAQLKNENATAILLTALDDIAWVFNIRGTDIQFNPVWCVNLFGELIMAHSKSYGFISLNEAVLFIDPGKVPATINSSFENLVLMKPYNSALEYVSSYGRQSSTTILLDPDQCNVAMFSAILDSCKKEKRSIVLEVKATKNAVELEGLRQAHIRDGVALVKFLSWLQDSVDSNTSNLTEVSVANMQESFRKDMENYVSPSFDTISSMGPNGAIIHYKPEESSCSVINTNELYLNDSGGQYLDGTTDVTRTLHLGTPKDVERDVFTRVLQGHIALAMTVFPDGIEGVKLDTITRAPLWRAMLDYNHGTGHGVGAYLNVHEKGVLLSSKVAWQGLGIRAGMVISNEPGCYIPGKFGVRIESVMIAHELPAANSLCTKKYCGFETITMAPIQKSLINIKLLSKQEIEWVNSYHKLVHDKLLPFLTPIDTRCPNALQYLKNETSPLL